MSLEAIQDRLTAFQETTGQLRELIDRLTSLDNEDGTSSFSGEDATLDATELGAEIGQLLREEEDELELLQEEVEDLRCSSQGSDAEHQRLRLREGVDRGATELRHLRVNFRKAQMAATSSAQRSQRRERQATLHLYESKSAAQPPLSEADIASGVRDDEPKDTRSHTNHPYNHRSNMQQSSLSQEDQQSVSASSNMTQALREMHDMMATELSKSEFAQQTLEESTAVMKQLGEDYGSLGDLVSSSANLIGVLLRSQKSDTWYLQTSLYMLVVTLAWLVFRRWFYGILWWVVWLPLRLFVGVSWKAGKAVSRHSPAGIPKESQVVIDGRAEVEGLPNDAVPTVNVGQGSEADQIHVGEEGSHVRMVEDLIGDGQETAHVEVREKDEL